ERAVGEQLAAGLARRAIVGFVLGIDDALDRRSAVRAGLAEAAVHGHALPERGDLLRERRARLGREPGRPRLEGLLRRSPEPLRFLLREPGRQLDRREPG